MQNFKAEDFPSFKVLSYEELEYHVERGRQMRSAAAYSLFAGLAGGLGRVIAGLRDRETTHWPARLDPGHKAG